MTELTENLSRFRVAFRLSKDCLVIPETEWIKVSKLKIDFCLLYPVGPRTQKSPESECPQKRRTHRIMKQN